MAFQKGKSGNSKGRPPGIRDKRALWRDALSEPMPEIIEAVKKKAIEGDVKAAKLLMDKAIPNARPGEVHVEMDCAGSTLQERAAAINDQALSGTIDAETAAVLLKNLESEARITQVSDLQPKIDRIDTALKHLKESHPDLLLGL